jgi:quercetin dioxygenase-like cupin family protein
MPTDTTLTTHSWMPGQVWTWHAVSAGTGGAYALAESTIRAGAEPPMHVHANEDEAFFVLEGEVTFMRGIDRVDARAGDHVFIPRGVPHGFALGTPQARMLVLVSPGGMEDVFIAHSEPAPGHELPPALGAPPSEEDMAPFVADLAAHGITFVGPPVGALLGAPA